MTSCSDRASCRPPSSWRNACRTPASSSTISPSHRSRPVTPHPWRSRIGAFAALEHVACKVSGLVTEADWSSWTAADLQPFVDLAIDVFGPERLLFGSDWPVCLLAATYPQVVGTARHAPGRPIRRRAGRASWAGTRPGSTASDRPAGPRRPGRSTRRGAGRRAGLRAGEDPRSAAEPGRRSPGP